jgi:hypothetical protein
MFFGLEKVNLCGNDFSSILLPDKEKEEAAEATEADACGNEGICLISMMKMIKRPTEERRN